jgi:tetratricopeptide (TPR) repeat protein
MDFEKIVQLVAKSCNYELLDPEKRRALVDMPLPAIIEMGTCVGGLQWFRMTKILGKIVDFSGFDTRRFLRLNSKREAWFAIRETNTGSLLVLVDRYAVPSNEPDDTVASILSARLMSEFDHYDWDIPGVVPESDNWEPPTEKKPHPTEPVEEAVELYNRGVVAQQQGSYDRATEAYERTLRCDPPAELRMATCLNLALAIWQRHGFQTRDSGSVSDEEFQQVKRVLVLYEQVMQIYEGLPADLKEQHDYVEMHSHAKSRRAAIVLYGQTKRNPDGSLGWRNVD